MAEKIYIGNFPQGLTQNPLPFNIDNLAFPYMYNFYTWRGRAKRKRGTVFLGRLAVQVSIAASTIALTADSVNLVTALSLGSTASIAPGTIQLTLTSTSQLYTEPVPPNGTLIGSAGATINYATGVITIPGGGTSYITGTFSYYPDLPVMGLTDFIPVVNPFVEIISSPYPQLLSFDTKYSYQNFNTSNLASTAFYNVNYFKNPNPAPPGYTGYMPKTVQTPFVWTASDHHQFWTTNFEQALWATNGTPGMQIQRITAVTWINSTSVTFAVANSPAVVGDFVFVNEFTDTGFATLNGQTGYVTAILSGGFTVVFPYADITDSTYTTGIVQYLTNVVPTASSTSMGDGIKWYDGDPTLGTGLPSISSSGWVNFSPPLSATSVTIDNYTSGDGKPYYLVGAKMILPYKDRLLFFGCYITTSTNALATPPVAPIYLQDTVIWSWNGAPYYTSSFDGTVVPAAKIVYNPILTAGLGLTAVTPEGAGLIAYYVDQNGLGGWLAAGIQQQIVTVGFNEDVVLVGFSKRQTRLIYTSNDLQPFLFYTINSELGSSATFSGVTLDRGLITFGTYGFALTTQTGSQRVDLQIPDEAFQIRSTNFGVQRINSARDYYKEWVYFSYCPFFLEDNNSQTVAPIFPTQTFFYNYREDSWAIFYENYTAHGSFWRYSSVTWATLPYATWSEWDSWDSSETQALFPTVVAGTPQGFVVVKGEGTGESITGYISAISAVTDPDQTQITSNNHCVASGDYLYFTGAIGNISLNNMVGQVQKIIDINNFTVDILFESGTYLGLGVFSRLSQPLIQSKQFPPSWGVGRQVRMGTQQYLLDTTADGQVTLNIYLSMNPDDAWNISDQVTDPNDPNDAILYSQILYTCPESTNIGLTPANTNLQMPTASKQRQIWHRMNTSLIGDTVQFGITLSDAQMRDYANAISEITLHAAVLDVYPGGPYLS